MNNPIITSVTINIKVKLCLASNFFPWPKRFAIVALPPVPSIRAMENTRAHTGYDMFAAAKEFVPA